MSDVLFEPAVTFDEDKGSAFKVCPTIASQQVCIQADIKIIPKVKVGKIEIFCDEPIIGKCGRVPCATEACEFTVSRILCVQVPLIFTAETFVHPAGHICGEPELEPCKECDLDPVD